MRVAIAELKQETNTFVSRPTTMADFETWHYWTGPDLIAGLQGTNSEIDGFLNVLDAAGIEPVPIIATFAMSGGKVDDATYERLLGELLAGISARRSARRRAARPAWRDGHRQRRQSRCQHPESGARRSIGPDLPLVATYDLHANLTARMAEYADALVGFKTSPHIDQRDTGERGARVMTAILQQGAKPTMAFVKIPMIVPASTHIHHLPGPFQRLQDATKELETELPGVLSANVAAVQPWLDIDEMGFATVVVTDDDPKRAETLACDLAKACWDERQCLYGNRAGSDRRSDRRRRSPNRKRSGRPLRLRRRHRRRFPRRRHRGDRGPAGANPDKPAYVFVRDAESAEAAIAAESARPSRCRSAASSTTSSTSRSSSPASVEFAGPAAFRFGGGGYTGVEQDMGPSAVVRAGNVYVLIVSNSVMTVDPELYRAVGLEPKNAQIVVVKSHIQFRAGYAVSASRIILLDSPGMSSDHIAALPWQKVPRPIFPLDPETYRSPARPGPVTGMWLTTSLPLGFPERAVRSVACTSRRATASHRGKDERS